MAQYPGLRVDVVELSQGVVNAAWYFSHINYDILRHPKLLISEACIRTLEERLGAGGAG